MDDRSFEAGLAELRAEFLAMMDERLDALGAALRTGPADAAAVAAAKRICHQIAGFAGTVALPAMGQVARGMERAVDDSAARPQLWPALRPAASLLAEQTASARAGRELADPSLDPRLHALAALPGPGAGP
jgi:HPt (histidine-containing phosphotransfer) domain-containing protein